MCFVVFVFVIVFGVWSLGGVDVYYGYGLEVVIFKVSVDFLVENDIFISLIFYFLCFFLYFVNFDVDKKKEEFLVLEFIILLRVKLVGFSEDYCRFLLLQMQLLKYIDILNLDVYVNVIGYELYCMMFKICIFLEVEKI